MGMIAILAKAALVMPSGVIPHLRDAVIDAFWHSFFILTRECPLERGHDLFRCRMDSKCTTSI